MKNNIHLLLITILVLVSGVFTPFLFAEPVRVEDTFKTATIGRNVEYIKDAEKKYKIETITNPALEWTKSLKDSLGFGFNETPCWYRFTISNTSNQVRDIYVEISNPLIDYLDMYIPKEKGGYRTITTGDYLPFHSRDVMDPNFVFHLRLLPEKQGTYYFRVYCPASTTTFVPSIVSEEAYNARTQGRMPFFWMYYGLMLVMVAYNLFIFFSIKEKSYLFLGLFIAVWAILQFTLGGYSYQYLWPNLPWWENQSIAFLVSLTQVLWVLFPRYYIETWQNFPKFDKVLIVTASITSLFCVLSFLVPYKIIILVVDGFAIYTISMLIVFAVYTSVKGSRPARFMLLAFAMLMIGTILYLLKSFGVAPENAVTQWSMQIGSSLMVVLLSLGLADHIHMIKNELARLNVNLENIVEERTAQLVKARDALWGEMQLAKKIQTVLLPKRPAIQNFEISAIMAPADEVGGDYYDIINVDGRDWIVIGDVSGHGVSAGLIMMMVQTAIHTCLNQNAGLLPSELLKVINKTITENIKHLGEDKYMTITVFAYHQDGKFLFSGRHLDIMIYRAKEKKVEIIETNGIWIGMGDELESAKGDEIFNIGGNDVMLVYTDGLTEATKVDETTGKKVMFGDERLMHVFRDSGENAAEEIKGRILHELEGYEHSDDITLVVVRRLK